MLSILKEAVTRIKNWVKTANLPQLLRFLNKQQSEYRDLIAQAKSFRSMLSLSADEGMDVSNRRGAGSKKNIEDRDVIKTADGFALQVKEFKAPNRKEIAEKSELVDRLEGAIESLKITIDRLQSDFGTNAVAKRAIKENLALLDELRASRDGVLDTLDSILNNHQPEIINEFAAALLKHVNSMLPADSYEAMGYSNLSVTSHETFSGKSNADIEFTHYLYIDGLDKELFNIDEFIIVLTGVISQVNVRSEKALKLDKDPLTPSQKKRIAQLQAMIKPLEASKKASDKATINKLQQEIDDIISPPDLKKTVTRKTGAYYQLRMYITSINKFAAPGHFPAGKEITGTSTASMIRNMNKEAAVLISAHSLSPVFNRIHVDITTQALRHGPLTSVVGVTDAVNADGDIQLTLSVNDKRIIERDIWPDVIVALNSVLGRRRRDANFTYTLNKVGSKTIMNITYVKG